MWKMFNRAYNLLWLNPFRPWFLITLIIINFLGLFMVITGIAINWLHAIFYGFLYR